MSAEVKPGFKLTEIGVIPSEWNLETCVDISDLITVGIVIKPTQYYVSSGVPAFRSANVRESGLTTSDLVFISPESNRQLAKSQTRTGDVLTVRTGYPGTSAVVRPEHNGRNCIDILITRPSKRVVPDYLNYWINSSFGKDQVLKSQGGLAQQHFNVSDMRSLLIALPDRDEQERIATALSDIDALISGLDQLIAKKRDIKQAAMQQLLTGQQRLPGFSGEWEMKTLFEIAEKKKELFDDGDWIESEHITNQGVRLIQTGNIGIGTFIEKDIRKYIYEKSFTSLRCKELRRGDLLLCRLADPAGRACVLPDIGEEKIVTSVDVTIFRAPTDTTDRVFLSNLFSTPEWFRAVNDRSGGTTHKRISRGSLGRISIKIPPVQEQTAIATILSDMDSELATLEARSDKARQIKQGMMQELLTGRIRLT